MSKARSGREYAAIDDNLQDLAQSKDPDAPARASALCKRRMTIEEELLTVIEGYRPV